MRLPTEFEQRPLQEVYTLERNVRMPYVTSAECFGIEKGRQEGRQEGEAALLKRLLARRFGTHPRCRPGPPDHRHDRSAGRMGDQGARCRVPGRSLRSAPTVARDSTPQPVAMSRDTPSRLRHCHRRAIQRSAVRRPVRQVRRRITGARLCILPVRTDNPAQRLRHRHRRTIFTETSSTPPPKTRHAQSCWAEEPDGSG